MTRLVMPAREEIRAAYADGDEAVIALFEQTLGQLDARITTGRDKVVFPLCSVVRMNCE